MKYIILLVILLMLLTANPEPKPNENFDVTVDFVHYPQIGKFDDCYQIGTRKNISLNMCKKLCNKMDRCEGISYCHYPTQECRMYSDTYDLYYNPKFTSWRNFWNKIY